MTKRRNCYEFTLWLSEDELDRLDRMRGPRQSREQLVLTLLKRHIEKSTGRPLADPPTRGRPKKKA